MPVGRRPTTALFNPGGLLQGVNTPDAAKFDIVGDVDLAWLGARPDWNAGAGTGLVSKWDTVFGGLRSYILSVTAARLIEIRWSVDGTAELAMTSNAAFPDPGAFNTLGIRAFLDVDAGGANRAATFSTSTDLGASWQQLGGVVTTAGVTSIFAGTSALAVAGHSGIVSVSGYHYQAWVRDSTGALVANPRFSDQPAKQPSFTDDQGNTWTVAAPAMIVVV